MDITTPDITLPTFNTPSSVLPPSPFVSTTPSYTVPTTSTAPSFTVPSEPNNNWWIIIVSLVSAFAVIAAVTVALIYAWPETATSSHAMSLVPPPDQFTQPTIVPEPTFVPNNIVNQPVDSFITPAQQDLFEPTFMPIPSEGAFAPFFNR